MAAPGGTASHVEKQILISGDVFLISFKTLLLL